MPQNNPEPANESRIVTLTVKSQEEVVHEQQVQSGLLIVPFRDITMMDPREDGATRVSISEIVEHGRRDVTFSRRVIVEESIPEIFEQAGFPLPKRLKQVLQEKFPKHLEKPEAGSTPAP